VKLQLTTAVVKLLLARPAESLPAARAVLSRAIADPESADLRDRAALYYRLLERGPESARAVVAAKKSSIVSFAEDEKFELQERLFDEFNTLSVIYGKPLAERPRFVAKSPSLEQQPQQQQRQTQVEPDPEPQQTATSLVDIGGTSPVIAAPADMQLVDSPVMDPKTFQANWGSMPIADKFTCMLRPDTIDAFVAKMKVTKKQLSCIAAGVVGDLAKVYAYSQQRDAPHEFLLVEVLIKKSSGEATVTTKSKDSLGAPQYSKWLRSTFL
jgi:hypothetical protein